MKRKRVVTSSVSAHTHHSLTPKVPEAKIVREENITPEPISGKSAAPDKLSRFTRGERSARAVARVYPFQNAINKPPATINAPPAYTGAVGAWPKRIRLRTCAVTKKNAT